MALTISYRSAAEFVTEYVENLAAGGLFVADACELDMLREVDVEIVLADARWRLRARPVYVVDEVMAATAGRRPGTGMEITHKPAGFDDAMRAHLVRLGKRREVALMIGEVPGAAKFGDAGFKMIPLESLEALGGALADAFVPVLALIVPDNLKQAYSVVARSSGHLIAVYSPLRVGDIEDIIRQLDRLL